MPRPKKNAVKKGRPSWKPASMLDTVEKHDGHRTRWCSRDSLNLQRKQAEGWVFANSITGINREHEHPEKVGDGHSLTSVTEYRDLVLMALPEDVAKERDKYFQSKTDAAVRSLKQDFEENIENPRGNTAEIYGKIVIE